MGRGAVDGFDLTETSFIGQFRNIDTLIGGTGSDPLTGLDPDATWKITGANAGEYTKMDSPTN